MDLTVTRSGRQFSEMDQEFSGEKTFQNKNYIVDNAFLKIMKN